jgi:hypothetical protein
VVLRVVDDLASANFNSTRRPPAQAALENQLQGTRRTGSSSGRRGANGADR